MHQPEAGRDWRHALVLKADRADCVIREAAWTFEERVLWRGSDTSREALERVSTAIRPLQRLIQTRLIWPVAEFLGERSARTRVALAASTVVLALAAAGAGAISAPHGDAGGGSAPTPGSAAVPVAAQPGSQLTALQGVAPRFHQGKTPVPAQAPAKPSAPPAQVAMEFAAAFVGYEVGGSGPKVDEVFATTATKQLAKALAADPPRLPAKGKVPRARVLNVVLGARAKNQATASVSLVRLRAISELRLTLTNSGDGWRVAQVLG